MNCNEETTTLDRARHDGSSADVGSDANLADGENLYSFIDRDRVWGSNLAEPEMAKECIKPWDQRESLEKWTESGVDDQFILTIPFTAPVRIRSVLLNTSVGDFAPQRFRAYVNRPNGIDFEEVEASSSSSAPGSAIDSASGRMGRAAVLGPAGSGKPQADFSLQEGATGVTEYPLSVARFQNVNSVSVVLSDSPSRDLSRLFYLSFRGTALQLKSDNTHRFDVGAANAADKAIDGVRERAAGAQSGGSVR